jgi:uncharacterized protein YbjT (DUF2867 family)
MILVIGATGKVGRQVVAQLATRGDAVRAVTRHPASARLPAGVEVVHGDVAQPPSLEAHLKGVRSVFLLWPFASPAAAADLAPPTVAVLARQVRRIVYLSAQAAADQPGSSWAVVERLIEASGVEWTFLRPTGFAANALMWADQLRTGGVVRWPYGRASRSPVHERDIAAVAVRALTEDGHNGARYLLSGPENVTQAEQVSAIGEVTGRDLRWEELEPEEARRQLLRAWGDPGFVESALAGWAAMVARPEPVTRTVEEVTGVPARTFPEWVQDHVADFGPISTAEIAGTRSTP